MASSSIPQPFIDDYDDEGFDWEAAVKEIDVVCAQTETNFENNTRINCPSTSSTWNFRETHRKLVPGKGNSFASSSRQSTLDRFITGIGSEKDETYGNGFCKNGSNSPKGFGEGEDEVRDAEGNASFVRIDFEAAKTWIYPVNVSRRDYQFNITRTALFSNTLVALPTGLGKTLIAAVVMYNYFRWFPEGKIVFAAPSRPLVLQQIEACHNVVGIPQEWTIDLTGQTSPTKRAYYWKSKRVFFVTPQVLEKDIFSGSCLVKYLVCLVIDEAHRATGNFSYCVAVRELMAVPVELRILALTATPGSKQQTVQHIIDNLQISTLEYRSESDPDVVPYVHDRKIELIEVAMGNDAVEVNDLILEVIRPYITRLGAFGLLQNRDFQTLSPCDLLYSRDKFRVAPPENLPQMKYGEIEGYFGVLITLYHIRKLLSSHGIKPAFEMLQEKLQQGSFARLMSRNELLLKAKVIMQQNISHGAPSPKLSKMIEVLIHHFKMKNPHESRVIIFSNFRGSVRDIMNALKTIGEFVKATEFIGQSSGKASKGQSQKVQQAVLEKFRAGGYNVIVATCIGEEGLDIMEVDLVICFDANISPLRMIQRMGRTGRKHEGRVVVLACVGSEVKGYMCKQANSKAIKKHMRNGGTNSFKFHSSPRMIPHVLKPEVQFVELCIEQFVPRSRKVNDDSLTDIPAYKTKLTDAENDLIAKYFCTSGKNIWRLSLTAFPHFQAFPSRVYGVGHSFRTGMLIDEMQRLQGLSFLRDSKAYSVEDSRASPEPCLISEVGEKCNDNTMKEMRTPINSPERDCREVSVTERKQIENTNTNGEPHLQNSQQKRLTHSFLFNSEFVTVDDLGRVLVLSPPEFPLKEPPPRKSNTVSRTKLLYHPKQESVLIDASTNLCKRKNGLVKDASASSQMRSREDDKDVTSKLNRFNASAEHILAPQILHTPISEQKSTGGENVCESPQDRIPTLFDYEGNDDLRDIELSPRLTNFLESGIVPESPIGTSERSNIKTDEFKGLDLVSTPVVHCDRVIMSPEQNEAGVDDTRGHVLNGQSSLVIELDIPDANLNKNARTCNCTCPIVEESISPLMNSGDKSESVEPKRKFRRLRKLGDSYRNKPKDLKEQINVPSRNCTNSCASAVHVRIQHVKCKKQQLNDAKVFVEEEAEVDSDVTVSADEEDEQDMNLHDSFIDDRPSPAATSTQAGAGAIDMMAVYRRSLLSQSPLQRMPNIGSDFTSSSESPSPSTSGRESRLLQHGSESTARNAASSRLNPNRVFQDPVPSGTANFSEEHGSKNKRKFHLAGYLPVYNLEKEFVAQSVAAGTDTVLKGDEFPGNEDISDDDRFYDAIDLDAVEEEAAELLRYKSKCSTLKQASSCEAVPLDNPATILPGSPSFDLGI